MIDPVAPMASGFLWGMGLLFGACFALPLLLAPMAWARLFRWRVEGEDHLTLYFGRCLGAVAAAIVVACLRAAPQASRAGALFDLIIVAGGLLAGVHVWGAIRRQQPWTETAEIALYVGATVAALLLHP